MFNVTACSTVNNTCKNMYHITNVYRIKRTENKGDCPGNVRGEGYRRTVEQ